MILFPFEPRGEVVHPQADAEAVVANDPLMPPRPTVTS